MTARQKTDAGLAAVFLFVGAASIVFPWLLPIGALWLFFAIGGAALVWISGPLFALAVNL